MHTDSTLIAGGVGLAKALNMGEKDIGSIALPYAHIGGRDYLAFMLADGFPAVLIEKFDLESTIETYKRHGVTMAGGSTAFYSMFLGAQRQQPQNQGVTHAAAFDDGRKETSEQSSASYFFAFGFYSIRR